MLRDEPPPPPPPPPELLLPLHPASVISAIRANAVPANAKRLRREASFTASKKLMNANATASSVTITNGVLRGRGSTKPGGNAESVVVSCAVQNANTGVAPLKSAPVGVQVTGAPRLAVPFLNCTV